MTIRSLAPNFRAQASDRAQAPERQARREFAKLKRSVGVAQSRCAAQPVAVTLQIVVGEAVHGHMLRRIRVAASPRPPIPIGRRCGVIAARFLCCEIARELHLPGIVMADRQRAEDRLAPTIRQSGLNAQGTVIKSVQLVLIPKH
ncbi:hypothetical protein [Sphingopyxis terrae]|uniref:hypothetical protein n=1 Tax=Sphingopyxis terrae TaxID=33052 RepID=UPI003F7FA5A0